MRSIYTGPSETEEGLSMSEEEDDQLTNDQSELARIISELDIDHKLITSAQRGDTEEVKHLLVNGAQVVTDENGSTALHAAAQNGYAEVVRLLLENGTDVDIPDSNGYTPLHKAAGHGHLDVLEVLINEGCDIDTQDDMYGNTPLHEAAWHGFSKSVDLLLKNKSNAFITNRAGCTPLHLAAQNGHNQSGRTLLYSGCSPDVKNNYGDTPLHTSARYGHAGMARILISARCSISEQNKNGDTALHITAAFKRRKIAKLLTESGIKVQLRNKQNETAIDIAKRKEHPEIIEIITDNSPAVDYAPDDFKYRQPMAIYDENIPAIPIVASHEKEAKKRSHNAFISWIKKKLTKKPNKKKEVAKPTKNVADDDDGLYSQYIKKPGFAYYRDLAGNIRQGPCGYVPAHYCGNQYSEMDDFACGNLHKPSNELTAAPGYLRGMHAKNQVEIHSGERHQAYLKNNENRRAATQLDDDVQEFKGDLRSWLVTHTEDMPESPANDNPFAYAIGARQTRFGDDFDKDRMSRYEVTEQFPPPPRLFRCRSDETLSHSEFSYHGRAYKSKEAAIEELKTLKHHEELKARRKMIRASNDNHLIGTISQLQMNRHEGMIAGDTVDRKHRLWQSRESIARHSKDDRIKRSTQNGNQHAEARNLTHLPKDITNDTAVNSTGDYFLKTENSHSERSPPIGGPDTATPATRRMTPAGESAKHLPAYKHVPSVSQPVINGINHEFHKALNGITPEKPVAAVRGERIKEQQAQSSSAQITKESEGVYSSQRVSTQVKQHDPHLSLNKRQLPTYDEVKNNRQFTKYPGESRNLNQNSSQNPSISKANQNSSNNPAISKANQNSSNNPTMVQKPPQRIPQQRDQKMEELAASGKLTVQTGESCCSSSNPDSGYGGQSYDFYASHPSPQTFNDSKATNEYDTWYNKRLQDAARKISVYSGLKPLRTMTTDV